jgi:hypothetical protein
LKGEPEEEGVAGVDKSRPGIGGVEDAGAAAELTASRTEEEEFDAIERCQPSSCADQAAMVGVVSALLCEAGPSVGNSGSNSGFLSKISKES